VRLTKKEEQRLRAKVASALVETLPKVGYERVRGLTELTSTVVKAVKEWSKESNCVSTQSR